MKLSNRTDITFIQLFILSITVYSIFGKESYLYYYYLDSISSVHNDYITAYFQGFLGLELAGLVLLIMSPVYLAILCCIILVIIILYTNELITKITLFGMVIVAPIIFGITSNYMYNFSYMIFFVDANTIICLTYFLSRVCGFALRRLQMFFDYIIEKYDL